MNSRTILDPDLGLGHPRILVIGDLILDRYTIGEAERVSPEAPVLVLREADDEVRLGGAANVAAFLRGLDCEVVLAGIVGEDHAGRTLKRLADESRIDCSAVLHDTRRPTTEKQRFAGRSGSRTPHQLLRVDREVRTPIDTATETQLLSLIESMLPKCQAVLISDYGKGVGTPTLLQSVIRFVRSAGKPILIDPSRGGDPQRYAAATMITPNRLATELWVGHPVQTEDEVRSAARGLREQLRLKVAVLTLDRDGLAFADQHDCERIPCRPRAVCDVTGAGDMVLAMLGLCAAEGLPLRESLQLANAAAGLEVERFGVTSISRAEIQAELQHQKSPSKWTTLAELQPRIQSARRNGKTIVFTNGCFDLLHAGHVQLLEEAAKLGDCLIVAVNSDASVQRLKGPTRPIIDEGHRARLLAALACVDHVVIFEDDTPHRLLEVLQPHVLVKGGTTDHIIGREVVEGYGGQVRLTSTRSECSTTRTVQRIQSQAVQDHSHPVGNVRLP